MASHLCYLLVSIQAGQQLLGVSSGHGDTSCPQQPRLRNTVHHSRSTGNQSQNSFHGSRASSGHSPVRVSRTLIRLNYSCVYPVYIRGQAWYDRGGYEADDKCAWSPTPFTDSSTGSNSDGTAFAYQYEWSNASSGCVKTRSCSRLNCKYFRCIITVANSPCRNLI